MADLIPLTFKVTEDGDRKIMEETRFHDLNRSDFVRQCIRIASPLLRFCPELLAADDARIGDLMGKCSKILVILEKN